MKEHGNDIVDFIPGIPSIRVADLPRVFLKDDTPLTLRRWPYKFSTSKVKCLLLGTAYELEPQVCDVFKEKLEYPVYFVGPLIPYYELYDSKTSTNGFCLTFLTISSMARPPMFPWGVAMIDTEGNGGPETSPITTAM
ncbi:hypothetical protein LWI28_020371 [Acer negundo]|uniref:Uncharacterized protein n=1 Tax=Acer negundo TaxID=4023 RepID=A0AAD5IP10_ACENE|nr:hypothetical protein LWI28_020371 [Acer negundo]